MSDTQSIMEFYNLCVCVCVCILPECAAYPKRCQTEMPDLYLFLIPEMDKCLRDTQEALNLQLEYRDKFSAMTLDSLFSLSYSNWSRESRQDQLKDSQLSLFVSLSR